MTGLSTTSAPLPLSHSHSLSPSRHRPQYQHHSEALDSIQATRAKPLSSPLLSSVAVPLPLSAHSPSRSPAFAPAPGRQNVALDLPESNLTFPDISADLLRLEPLSGTSQITTNTASSNNRTVPPVNHSASQRRKPSPGLAARLRALGFGSSTKETHHSLNLSQQHDVGRLSEDQLRSLDLNHQLHSAALVVERRGRPWKGAGAPLHLLRSKSSRDSFRKRGDSNKILSLEQEKNSPRPELLPEISPTQPLDMDTNEYYLPGHINGAGPRASSVPHAEDFERDTCPSPMPPPPPPKDTPPDRTASAEFSYNHASYFNPLGLHRSGSIYTISRASFANQLAQLTALQLPDAELLSSKVAAIPTAQAAARALLGAAEQIRSWIGKASEVIEGLDSEDDVEWAAAGGREGYEEVENAITRFESLINVYVTAIEDMQSRDDIAAVSNEDLEEAVTQMESIMADWTKIRKTLDNAKGQVETAMEWEELWSMVLGDIQNEMDELSRLVFEMEERRHKSIMAVSSGDGIDIGDLETIVEETPPAVARNNRYSMPMFPISPGSPGAPPLTQDDSSMLALFARMQPLRASLDFLPMRLSVFEARASGAFPTACEELVMRRAGLEASYTKLEKDADSLRKELGEDKWVLVFRGAGRQAQKLVESVDRSVAKLRESVDQGLQFSNPPVMSKNIESYEAKKIHYGPAIERVLSIIDKGVKDRLTVNGEILRLHTEMQSRWEDLKRQMKDMDSSLEEIQADKRNQQLRDSISSLLSNDRSTVGSGNETPSTSPPSSVVMPALGVEAVTPKSKSRSASTSSSIPQSSARRYSSTLAPPPRRSQGSRLSTISNSSGSSTPIRSGSAMPPVSRPPRSLSSMVDNRPRWSQYTSARDSDVGLPYKTSNHTPPSPYSKTFSPPLSASAFSPTLLESKLPLRSPFSRRPSASSIELPPSRGNTHSRLSFRERITTGSLGTHPPETASMSNKLTSKAYSATPSDNRRISLQPPKVRDGATGSRQRSASSMATSRRTSLLPMPRNNDPSSGRASVAGSHKSQSGTEYAKPRWRY
ncbi:KAR9-domain-containing protein [Xylaria nigripes]|nr:KAR9-domain-containing protein [Xylaria nigripes]